MIVAGRVSQKMAPVLRQIYDQMMEPVGHSICRALSGGRPDQLRDVQGVDQVVPVDGNAWLPARPQTPCTPSRRHQKIHDGICRAMRALACHRRDCHDRPGRR
jgi:NADH-quinone oxidoreductase subunit B